MDKNLILAALVGVGVGYMIKKIESDQQIAFIEKQVQAQQKGGSGKLDIGSILSNLPNILSMLKK